MSSGPDHLQTSNGQNFAAYQQSYLSGWQNGAPQQQNPPPYQPGMMGPPPVLTANEHSFAPSGSQYMNNTPLGNGDPFAPSTSMAHSTQSGYIFTSDMINSAATSVVNGKSESIFAWHEQNVRASTSDGIEENGRSLKRKSSSNDSSAIPYSNGSASGMRPSSVHDLQHQNGKPMSSSMDDNPLRKMEKMTQESSLFQPPTKKPNCDYAAGIKDQDRNSKLERLNQMAQTLHMGMGSENMGMPMDKRGEHPMMMPPNQKMFMPGMPPQNMQRMPMQPPYAPGPGPNARGPGPPYFRAPGPPGMPQYHAPGMNGMPTMRPSGTPPMMPPHSGGPSMPGTNCPPPYPFPGPAGPVVNSPTYSAGYAPQPPMSGINSSGGPGFPPLMQNHPIDTMGAFPMNGPNQLASPRFPGPPDGMPLMMNAQFNGGGPGAPMGPPQMPPPNDMYNWQHVGFPQPLTNLDSRVPSQKVQYFPPNGQMPPQCAPTT
uniref:PUM-HD domain-containing protein n=1 Tax=Steinernema glaseri TaxID=37863 RepID=A0A1I8A7G1_9BILA